MGCGCPVITSNGTACQEVAGNAALLVDPHSVDAIAEGMGRIQDAALRASLRQRGLERARQFTWRATAERYLELFRGVARRVPMDSPSLRALLVRPESGVRP
jgi:glycosyltransferase involved in cell wall biosynthesis